TSRHTSVCRLSIDSSTYLTLGNPNPTLFPYTTLFRSVMRGSTCCIASSVNSSSLHPCASASCTMRPVMWWHSRKGKPSFCTSQRSEEHTSELQSRENLVCRLLLEKKKNIYKIT